jgi:CHAT domain-containing protein
MELKSGMARSILCELLTLALPRTDDPRTQELALTWVLRLKAAALDTMCRYRELQRAMTNSPEVAEQAARVRQAFDAYMKRLAQPVGPNEDAFRLQVNTLRFERDRQEADLHRLLERQRPVSIPTDVTIASVRDRLPPESALVEIIRMEPYDFTPKNPETHWKDSRYVAFVLTRDRALVPRLIDLGEAATLERSVKEFREALTRAPRELSLSDEKSVDTEFRELSAGLSLRVFSPIRAALKDAKTVFLAPDGVFNLLPFDALAENGKYLIESFRFRYLSTGRDLLRPKTSSATGTTVFAGPDFDWRPETAPHPVPSAPSGTSDRRLVLRGVEIGELRSLRWKTLPGAAREAEDIQKALADTAYSPVRLITGAQARKATFTEVAAPRVLHIATHGFFLAERSVEETDEPGARSGDRGVQPGLSPLLRSGLVFTGANQLTNASAQSTGSDEGWLTAEEVAQMNLRGTELVVLSACESGLGDVTQAGEGVFGLRRAFFYAGARSLVVSLFKVPDTETRELMQGFYLRLKKGMPPPEALHEAKRELISRRREEHKAAHPFFWASFILIGSGG